MKIFNLSKTYKLSKNQTAPALKGISFELPERGMVFILGRSGSGKSTLLNILSGLDGFDGGDVIFEGKSFKEFTDADRNAYRNGCCGFVFQEYNLIPELTVGENVALATLAVCTAATPALCAALNCALLGQYAAQGMAIFVFGALPALALVAIAATFALLGCALPALKIARMKSAEILRSL